MKKIFLAFFALMLVYSAAACSNDTGEILPSADTVREKEETNEVTRSETNLPSEISAEFVSEQSEAREENIVIIEITVNDLSFSAEIYDNETTEKFVGMLPLTLDMSELNGNEKYYYLESSLPANADVPSSGIRSGDIMLYGSDCLVLFYDSFSTSYSYTPIGHIDNSDGLADVLGKGNVTVTFKLAE